MTSGEYSTEGLKRHEPVSFSRLMLETLPWKENAYKGMDVDTALLMYNEADVPCMKDGVDMKLHAECRELFNKTAVGLVPVYQEIEFELGNNAERIDLEFKILYGASGGTVETGVIKEFLGLGISLPRGTGLELYGKTLDFIQSLADSRKIPYIHKEDRELDYSETRPISEGRWNAMFLPILHSRGYVQNGPNQWIKAYTAQQSNIEQPILIPVTRN